MSKDTSPMLFVSHHSSKLGVAEHVEKALNSKGVRCWIAPRDVEPGASFARAIPSAIGESSAVLLLFCSNSAKSRHVERELILADQLGKAIIPLRLERIDPGELSYHLAASQWIDWLEQRDEAIDRIALKARDLQAQASNGNAKTGTISIDEIEAKAPPAVDISKSDRPDSGPGTPPPPDRGPVSLDRPGEPSDTTRAPLHGGSGGAGPTPGSDAPPRDPNAKPSKLPLYLALGGVGALLLIALAYLIISSVMTPARITEASFEGLWSYSEDCNQPIRFDPNGELVTPEGNQGTWAIEGRNRLVVEIDGDRTDSALTRINADEMRSSDGTLFRCN